MQRRALGTALALAAAPAVALGFGRFAFGLLLPDMRAGLGWSYALAGWMGTANAAGYGIGALAAGRVLPRIGLHAGFAGGLVASVVALALSGLGGDAGLQLASRALGGLSAGLVTVAGASLALGLERRSPGTPALVLFFAGVGFGLGVTALTVGGVRAADLGWQGGWLGLAAAAAVLAAIAAARSRAVPPAPVPDPAAATRPAWGPLAVLLPAYLLYGAGSVAHVTFVAARLRETGADEQAVALVWGVMGVAACATAPLWPRVLRALPPHLEPAALLTVTCAGAGVLLAGGPPLASAAVFGAAFLGVPAAVTAAAGGRTPPPARPVAVAWVAVAYALGLAIGPLVVGAVADARGLRTGMAVAFALLVASAVLLAADRARLTGRRRRPAATPRRSPSG